MQFVEWSELDPLTRKVVLQRPALCNAAARSADVEEIIRAVRKEGDIALRIITQRFDGACLDTFGLSAETIAMASDSVDAATRAAIDLAFENIRRFHEPSGIREYALETVPGVECRRLVRPLAAVGLYVPGGSAPLPSTVLMLGVPAMLAGCETVVLCTPPGTSGNIAPEILYAAKRCGIRRIIRAGGAQAIAAMAYGTESIPRVDKIFGPGNGWVTEAKRQVAQDPDGAVVDMPAGPSEVLVVADEFANPAFVAADLLSQAEHGPDSQVILLSTSRALIDAVADEIAVQLERLPRAGIARSCLKNSRAMLVQDTGVALEIVNAYAPEHLILAIENPAALLPEIRNAGSVFLGRWTPESLGDYVSGTNHVLPTYGYARQFGGLNVADFQKTMTVQSATAGGMRRLGPAAVTLATAEDLTAHARAVSLRLDALENAEEEVRRERA